VHLADDPALGVDRIVLAHRLGELAGELPLDEWLRVPSYGAAARNTPASFARLVANTACQQRAGASRRTSCTVIGIAPIGSTGRSSAVPRPSTQMRALPALAGLRTSRVKPDDVAAPR
jgi:hypothetical protein